MAAQLYGQVREWVPRERRFQVLVLANLCSVIARELRAGEEPAREDAALFRALLGSEGDEPDPADAAVLARTEAARLSSAIRAGELDERLAEVIEDLQAHVRRKLDVARPGYAD